MTEMHLAKPPPVCPIDAPHHGKPPGIAAMLTLFAAAAVAILIQFISAATVLPAPHIDAVAFIPAAIEFHATGQLANWMYPLADATDPTGASRYLFHGPLFPWLLGLLMPEASPRGAFLVIAALRAVTFLGFALAAWVILRRHAGQMTAGHRHALLVAAVVFLFAQAGMRLPPVGRPEVLGELLVLAGALCLGMPWIAVALPLEAITLGLMGAAHPAGAMLLGTVFAGALGARLPPGRAIAAILALGVGGVALALAIIAASPNGLAATLAAISAHAGGIAERNDGGLFSIIRYFFFWWDRFFFLAFFILAAVWGLGVAWSRRRALRAPWVFWAAIGLAAVLIWAFAIRIPPTSYNLSQFTPLVLLGLLLMAATLPRPGPLLALAIAAGLVSSVALLKQGTEVVAALAQGRTYDVARAELRGLLPAAGCVLVDPRSWVLMDDYRHMRLQPDEPGEPAFLKGCEDAAPLAFLLVPRQADACSPTAPPGEARVLADRRSATPPAILGRAVTAFPAGYGFCLGIVERP